MIRILFVDDDQDVLASLRNPRVVTSSEAGR